MKRFAQYISILFNPFVFCIILPYIVIFRETGSFLYATKWQLFTSAFIFLAAVFLFYGKRKKIFTDYDISKREERPKFYGIVFLIALCYFAAAVFLKGFFFPLSLLTVSMMFGIILFDVVNSYTKASMHVGVAVGFILTMCFLYGFSALLYLWWIVPLVIWARIILKRHTAIEVIIGGILGFVIPGVTFFLIKLISQT